MSRFTLTLALWCVAATGCLSHPATAGRPALVLPIINAEVVEASFSPNRTGLYRVVFKVPLPINDTKSREIVNELFFAPTHNVKTPEFQFVWQLDESGTVLAHGKGSDGFDQIIAGGAGALGTQPYLSSGVILSKTQLEARVSYRFRFSPAPEFEPLLKAAPIIQIELERP